MKILLHTCCAPCLCFPLETLRDQGLHLSAYYYNPNIHPYSEYLRRLEALERFCEIMKVDLMVSQEDPGMETWFRAVSLKEDSRCEICYELRLDQTALKASELGFDYFSTTLLYSKFQKHDDIIRTGQAMAKRYSIEFFSGDWRKGWNRGVKMYRKLGLYRQGYCGCVYSERERIIAKRERIEPGV